MFWIGVCGDDCSWCPRYVATQNGSLSELERLKELWVRLGFRDPGIPVRDLVCFGCESEDQCAYSELRACAREKGIDNCGLLLTEAAKHLKSGKAIGVDLWQSRDQSGSTAEAALANARAENVAERVEIKTGDMRSLPIENDSVDIVVSSLAIHNIPTREGRVRAIGEISRVLRPGGRVALLDLNYTQEYVAAFMRQGWSHVERSGPVFLMYPPVRVVYGTKPGGPLEGS